MHFQTLKIFSFYLLLSFSSFFPCFLLYPLLSSSSLPSFLPSFIKEKQTNKQKLSVINDISPDQISYRQNYQDPKQDAIRTTMRYHLTQVKMAIIKKSTNNKCCRGCGEKGTLLYCWWEFKLVQLLWKTVWRFLKKLKIELPYDLAVPLPGIYLDKTIIQKYTCTLMFIAALFTIAKTWKQPKCPLTDEWIKKMWYIYNGILAIKRMK